MSRVAGLLAASVVLPLLLAGCTTDPSVPEEPAGPAFSVDVDVDSPQLRALKKDAGVEVCVPGEALARDLPDAMPAVVLPCLGGGPSVNLSSLKGPTVINLWAQWCGPCRDELPYYQQLHERAGDRVQVLGIDYQDTQPRQALELVRDTGVTFPLLADPAGLVRVPFRVRGLPGVLFVDDGTVVHLEYTVIRSYQQLRDLVLEHLDVTV